MVDPGSIPSGAYAIAQLGLECQALMFDYFAENDLESHEARSEESQEFLRELGNALYQAKWADHQAANLVGTFLGALARARSASTDVRRWVLVHPNDPDAVIDCLNVVPPRETTIIRLLSRAGSQKVVFLAQWQLTQRPIVLKQLKGEYQDVVDRESRTHPLSMRHPNIIESYLLKNDRGEYFIAEEHLPEVWSDRSRVNGIEQAASLLYDLANALVFLHETCDPPLVHGDIKPDNIGIRQGRFVLMDFGICRPAKEFTAETSATGSLRTRAPELLLRKSYDEADKVDVWALGATVFHALTGRFPLFEEGEAIPRVTSPDERAEAEGRLAGRILNDWDRFVDLTPISHPGLREILGQMLESEPTKRLSAKAILEMAHSRLRPFLRFVDDDASFSPIAELNQILNYLPLANLATMPIRVRNTLSEHLARLEKLVPEFEDRARVQDLRATIDSLARDG